MRKSVDLTPRFELQLDVCGKCGWHGFIKDLVPEKCMPLIANEVATSLSNKVGHTLKLELFLASEVVKCPACGEILRIIVRGLSDKDYMVSREHHSCNVPNVLL